MPNHRINRNLPAYLIIGILIVFVLFVLLTIAANAQHLDVSWSDNSDNEDGFELYRSEDGTTFNLIATPGQNVEFHRDSNVLPGNTYWYKVLAYNVKGKSAFSNTASGTVAGIQGIPIKPGMKGVKGEGRIIGLSARGYVDVGDEIMIGGFTIVDNNRTMLIRATGGDTIKKFGIENPLADPLLTVLDKNGTVIGSNDNWGGDSTIKNAAQQVGLFGVPDNSLDAALILDLPPGDYTFHLSGVGATSGVAHLAVYDITPDVVIP